MFIHSVLDQISDFVVGYFDQWIVIDKYLSLDCIQ